MTTACERSSARSLEIVIGSRRLARSSAERWALDTLDQWFRGRATYGWFLSGGAPGPDSWGFAAARKHGREALEFRLDGRRWRNGKPSDVAPMRWTEQAPPPQNAGRSAWKSWCLRRDDAIVKAAARALGAGWEVHALALVAAWKGTGGTEYTAQRLAPHCTTIQVIRSPIGGGSQ